MLVRLVLLSWPCDLPTTASQSAGITGLSHCAWPPLCLLSQLNFVLTIPHSTSVSAVGFLFSRRSFSSTYEHTKIFSMVKTKKTFLDLTFPSSYRYVPSDPFQQDPSELGSLSLLSPSHSIQLIWLRLLFIEWIELCWGHSWPLQGEMQ